MLSKIHLPPLPYSSGELAVMTGIWQESARGRECTSCTPLQGEMGN
jgi:hypothetical protein